MSPLAARIQDLVETLVLKYQPTQLYSIDPAAVDPGEDVPEGRQPAMDLVMVCATPPMREKLRKQTLELEQMLGGPVTLTCMDHDEWQRTKGQMGRKACLAATRGHF